RCFASCAGNVKYSEGSYAKFLLVEDVVKEDVSFGYGGFARPLKGKGLGVTVNERKLEKYVKERAVIQ
ncbi:MAG: dipeptide epimerase, partial [Candidatus Omnitrophota bacterium]|nr:dipeptide epimerase [Candidatus Omnitrophota bacterium]